MPKHIFWGLRDGVPQKNPSASHQSVVRFARSPFRKRELSLHMHNLLGFHCSHLKPHFSPYSLHTSVSPLRHKVYVPFLWKPVEEMAAKPSSPIGAAGIVAHGKKTSLAMFLQPWDKGSVHIRPRGNCLFRDFKLGRGAALPAF